VATGNDIELVLVSGNPVTLHQPLYTAFYTHRVEVPVTTAARLLPRTDDADQRPGEVPQKSSPLAFVPAPAAFSD